MQICIRGYKTIDYLLKFKHIPNLTLHMIVMETTISKLLATRVLLSLSFVLHSTKIGRGQLLPIVNKLENSTSSTTAVYIVHVQMPKNASLLSRQELRAWHESFLPNKTLDSGEPRLLYSYREAISGFAARLSPEEARKMEEKEGFLMAQLDKAYPLATTYSPQFLGLSQWDGAWYDSTYQGQGKVIGVLDSGAVKDHPSFGDDGMPLSPTKWTGTCLKDSQIICNRKIIGAVGFSDQGVTTSAIDTVGHGTQVASIAAGNFVDDASVLGTAPGTASGTAPRAHLAIYKVCFDSCEGRSILAGIEQAISDKVDIVSMSIGAVQFEFDLDNVALGCMGAFLNGISPVIAAGNDGPRTSTLAHEAPWALTVGATSTDRRIRTTVVLGNGDAYDGESAFQPSSFDSNRLLPLVYPGEHGDVNARCCVSGSLSTFDVKNKIVMCSQGKVLNFEKGQEVFRNGGSAMIVMNARSRGYTTDATAHFIPASQLTAADSDEVREYYRKYSGTGAYATIIFGGTVFSERPAPALASFSSRGPATLNGGILKPDVVAPGVNILGAWHEEVGPNPTGTLKKIFNFDSGTSMATPHVSGIVALVKNKYPSWDPSTVQSAIITSANNFDLDGNSIRDENSYANANVFAVGAGQVNTSKALDPGLVYYISHDDYISYVCGLGYNNRQATLIFKRPVDCDAVQKIYPWNLNYPSISLNLRANSQPVTMQRTVINVGDDMSTYRARPTWPSGLSLDISPNELKFTRKNQEISFSITFTVTYGPGRTSQFSEGRLEWVSDKHVIGSPIAINWI